MDKKDIVKEYCLLVKGLGQLLNLFRLYKSDHPIFKEKVVDVFAIIEKLMIKEKTLTLSESGEVFLVNGEKIDAKDMIISRVIQRFHDLKIGSMDLISGIDIEEFVIFISLLSQAEKLTGAADIKNYLDSKGAKHIVPRFVTYKLIKEGEKVVAEEKTAAKAEVSPDARGRFLQDLKNGSVDGLLKEEKKDYQILAHDPTFLFEFICSLIEKNSGVEEIVKILWLIGDYLINEVNTAREENANRRVLAELKDRFFYFSEKRDDKVRWQEAVKKTFDEIDMGLELKGLAVIYKKHKKELEILMVKINKKMKTLSTASKVYMKTKEDLGKIGPVSSFPEVL